MVALRLYEVPNFLFISTAITRNDFFKPANRFSSSQCSSVHCIPPVGLFNGIVYPIDWPNSICAGDAGRSLFCRVYNIDQG